MNIWKDCEKKPLPEILSCIVDNRGKTVPIDPCGKHKLIATNCIRNENLYPSYEKIRFLNDDTYDTWFRAHPLSGDILFVCKGTPGRVCLVPDPVDFCIAQDMVALRADEKTVYNKYLLAVLRSREIQEQIRNTSVGDVIPHFKKQFFGLLMIPIPDMSIQKTIGDIYYNMSEKCEISKRINDKLSQQLRLIFQNTFINGDHPEWPIQKIGNFLSLDRGLSYKGKYLSDNEGVPMINLGNILPNSVFRPEKLKFYTGDFKTKAVVKPGDIVVANTDLTQAREVLGSAILIPDLNYPTIICSHHISIVRDCQISKHFIHGLLNSPSYRERVIGFATGTTVLALPNETILNCEFSMPPVGLIDEYDSIAESIYQKSEQIRKENKQLISLRDSILPRLMSGELDATEASL